MASGKACRYPIIGLPSMIARLLSVDTARGSCSPLDKGRHVAIILTIPTLISPISLPLVWLYIQAEHDLGSQ